MPPTPEQDHLRATARRVGELIRTCPPLAARLQQAWDDYKGLHVGHDNQTRRCAELQRQHAIEIMKNGFLEEQPRRDYEPSWDWESFCVRVPKHLLKARDAEKDASKRAPIIAKLAAAVLEYLEWNGRVKACHDEVSGDALDDRMDAAMSEGEYVGETVRVGFRPRPEFEPGPHPLFCEWGEYQMLALPTRVTVALAVLAVLHDQLSATPVLAPLPRYSADDPAGRLDAVVSHAVRGCLSVTQSREGSSEPPTPDPKRLSIERAEAYLSVVQAEAQRLSSSSPEQPTPGSPSTVGARSASALPTPGGSFVFLADNPPLLDGPSWEAPLRNWLLTVAMEVREKLGPIEPSTDPHALAQLRLPLPPSEDARQWLGLIATVFIDRRVPQRDYAAALARLAGQAPDLKWDGPYRPVVVEGLLIRVVHSGFAIEASTVVEYTQRSMRKMLTILHVTASDRDRATGRSGGSTAMGGSAEAGAGDDALAERPMNLTKIERDLLQAAAILGALDIESAVSGEEIAEKAGYSHNSRGGHVGGTFGILVRRGFMMAKRGHGGGRWLTPLGVAALNGPTD